MEVKTSRPFDTHRILRAKGLHLVNRRQNVATTPPPEVAKGDYLLHWQGYTEEFVPPATTRPCLWRYLEMGQASPEDVLDFVARWGLIEFRGKPDEANWGSVENIVTGAHVARDFLVALAATSAQELLPLESLRSLGNPRRLDNEAWSIEVWRQGIALGVDPAEIVERELDERVKQWVTRRAKDEGIELQQELVADCLDEIYSPSTGWPTWDKDGRRIERIDTGVQNIVWSHLYSMFTSPALDVYVCGVCGRPFEFDEASAERRPRSGVRALCSDECRREAKRWSNRQAWQRNKVRWRPSKRGRGNG